jgi:hypothetical protein
MDVAGELAKSRAEPAELVERYAPTVWEVARGN